MCKRIKIFNSMEACLIKCSIELLDYSKCLISITDTNDQLTLRKLKDIMFKNNVDGNTLNENVILRKVSIYSFKKYIDNLKIILSSFKSKFFIERYKKLYVLNCSKDFYDPEIFNDLIFYKYLKESNSYLYIIK